MIRGLLKQRVRLWVVALAFFAGGAIAQVIIGSHGDAFYLLSFAYGCGLIVWAYWALFRLSSYSQAFGCSFWGFLAFASFLVILANNHR